jgi:hypothetical protein
MARMIGHSPFVDAPSIGLILGQVRPDRRARLSGTQNNAVANLS